MKLIRYNTPLNQTANELTNWFRSPFGNFEPFGGLEPFSDLFGHRFRDVVAGDSRLAADVYEDDDNYYAQLHLPGVDKKDLTVKLEPDGSLHVSLEKTTGEENEEVLARASRRLQFPEATNAEDVKGKFENGVLTLTVPKTEAKKPHTIEIA